MTMRRSTSTAVAIGTAAAIVLGTAGLISPPTDAAAATSVPIAEGVIRTSAGEPADGADVEIFVLRWTKAGGQSLMPLGSTVTTDDGSFRVDADPSALNGTADGDGDLQLELVATAGDQSMIWDYPLDDVTSGIGSFREQPQASGLDLTIGLGATPGTEGGVGATRIAGRSTATAPEASAATSLFRVGNFMKRCAAQAGDFSWRRPKPGNQRRVIRWLPVQAMLTKGRAKARVSYDKTETSSFSTVISVGAKGVSTGFSRTSDSGSSYGAGTSQRKGRLRTTRVDIRYITLQGYCQIRPSPQDSHYMKVRRWVPYKWRSGLSKTFPTSGFPCTRAGTTKSGEVHTTSGRSLTFTQFGSIKGVGLDSSVTTGDSVFMQLRSKSGRELRFCGFNAIPPDAFLLRER